MRRVQSRPEPANFEATVRVPGQRLLKERRGDPSASPRPGPKRKPVATITPAMLVDYWTRCLDDLAAAFDHVCAYSCVRIDPMTGARTVDHFLPKSKAEHLDVAYEWSNYRYACNVMNTRKGDHMGICDPFEVEDGWFELNLVTFGLKPAPHLSGDLRVKVERTIELLELDGDAMRTRRADAWERYAADRSPAGWKRLVEECPLVALEYRRQRGAPSHHRSKIVKARR
jgi:hypothetical protein